VGIRSYEDLEVYQESYQLVLEVYQLTKDFPKEERYELTTQLKRAALSVVLNIAEGYGRGRTAEFKHFLRNSLGSANEVIVLLKLAQDLGCGQTEELVQRYDTLGKRIYRLREVWEKRRD
jgi:four helix bundle protein